MKKESLMLFAKHERLVANPVDYDTRDGCTLPGVGVGTMPPLPFTYQAKSLSIIFSKY